MGLDRNQIIGIILIMGLFMLWTYLNAPTPEEIAEKKAIQDSLARLEQVEPEVELDEATVYAPSNPTEKTAPQELDSSVVSKQLQATYGAFATAAAGQEETHTLENALIKVTFSSKGGRIANVLVKDHFKIELDADGKERQIPLYLLADEKDIFTYDIPVSDARQGAVTTHDLYFDADVKDNAISFTARSSDGHEFIQTYRLAPDSYTLDYDIALNGVRAGGVILNWTTYLDRLELNSGFEQYYTSVYYKEIDDDPDYCKCRKSDVEDRSGKPLKWVSHSNQFFNSSLIANQSFDGGVMETVMLDKEDENLKILKSTLDIPLSGSGNESFAMQMYIGPNEFERLRQFDQSLEDIIPFGTSIFGTINRWVIRPLFNFLSRFVGSQGIVILLLTLLVKLALFPLTYRMLLSQAKMSALKPQLAGLRDKFKDDQQKQQMETMKVYREFGVSPLGGCLPMVAQMPIWFALYRFFPASIEFRQEGFLWATDLSSYDVFFRLPFEIPMYGGHISLLTLLWVLTTLVYTYYNTRHMDMASMNPMMKYMQYFMPVMFLFFFNNYASGLTLYLLFSNILNIGLTIGTKQFVFDNDKILAGLEENRKKPKKKGGFSQRLEKALQEQQRAQAQRDSKKKK